MMRNVQDENRELSVEMLEQVSGSGIRVPVTALAGKISGGGSGPHRQPVDPSPYLGTGYNGDSFDTDPSSGGYMGDGNYYHGF